LTTYVDPEGSISGTFTPRLDFDQEGIIQPLPIGISNTSGTVSFYGVSSFGSSLFGGKLKYAFNDQIIGSGFTVSFQYFFDGTDPPFSLDALALEYATNDRQ
jgi:hypothetical protein